MLSWIHFGDLHVSDEDGWESLERLRRLTDEAEMHLAWAIDFAFLPGDNANHGEPEQYLQIRQVLADFALRWFAIPGDHDFEPQSLANFYEGLKAPSLPLSVKVKGHRCLFLDVISPGGGGPDFRLGPSQTDWLKDQLEGARSDPQRPVVFMHAFPGDLAEDAESIARLFADYGVACVDTGHTHYNEVLNDGGVIYTATRSTGQIEEGPAGFSIHAVDGSVTSWRFKPLDSGWPFVLITSPGDYRMIVDPGLSDQAPRAAFTVHARVFGGDVATVELAFDDREAIAMTPVAGLVGLWAAEVEAPAVGRRTLSVTAVSADGQVGRDSIKVQILAKDDSAERRLKPNPGGHVHSIGAWPERGLLGTQLGPNKNGTIAW